MSIDKRKVRRIGVFHRFLSTCGKPVRVLYGGAGSGKSIAISQHIAEALIKHDDLIILCTRATGPSLAETSFRLICDAVREYGIPAEIRQMPMTIKYKNNVCVFKSLDDPEKFKSMNVNWVWVEEATEVSRDDFFQLRLRMRRPGKAGNIAFLTFNPISQYNWAVEDYVLGKPEDADVMHSTYLDNPYLNDDARTYIESLKDRDENWHRVYTLGLPGALEGLVFKSWGTAGRDDIVGRDINRKVLAYGLDFGYNHPMALVGVYDLDGSVGVCELIHRRELTITDLIKLMDDIGIGKGVTIYCDPSRPDAIEEITRAGYAAVPAENAVKDGIDHIKSVKLTVSTDSANLINELRNYSWKKDRDGHFMEVPVDVNDDAIDAMRYAIYSSRAKGLMGGDTVSDDELAVGGSLPDF